MPIIFANFEQITQETMAYKFFMKKVVLNADGTQTIGEEKDLEADFDGIRYKSMSGLENYGAPASVYTETAAESGKAMVYVSTSPTEKQTELTLTLYFFPSSTSTATTDASKIAEISTLYHSFCDFIRGGKIIYRDTVRKRKVLMTLTGAISPATDRLYGQIYKEVSFTFTNEYGCTFAYDDETIETNMPTNTTQS